MSSKVTVKILYRQAKKLRHLAGPWPIEPFYLGFLTFFMVASLYAIHQSQDPTYVDRNLFLRPALSTFVAFMTLFQLKVTTKLFPQYKSRFSIYFLILTIQAFSIWAWLVLFRNLFPHIHSSYTAFLSPIPLTRFLFTLLTVNAFIGLSRERLMTALSEKEEMLRLVNEQSRLLLDYDETTRSEISAFLHDRVQSSLVTSCFELREISENLPGDAKVGISKVIESLEHLRANDVRSASQALSPAMGNADLSTSISVMAKSYAPHISITIRIDPEVESLQNENYQQQFLGIYRIVEQAFLNCAIHGMASRFAVEVHLDGAFLEITTSNDGNHLPSEIKSGLGSAIINSWVNTLHGQWEMRNQAIGVSLTAKIPF